MLDKRDGKRITVGRMLNHLVQTSRLSSTAIAARTTVCEPSSRNAARMTGPIWKAMLVGVGGGILVTEEGEEDDDVFSSWPGGT